MEITIEGIAPHIDGTYQLPAPLTTQELHEVKVASGIRPAEIGDAYASGDAAFKAVMAVIALRHVGKQAPLQVFMDATYDKTEFVFPELEKLLAGASDDPPTTPKPRRASGKSSLKSSANRAEPQPGSGGQT